LYFYILIETYYKGLTAFPARSGTVVSQGAYSHMAFEFRRLSAVLLMAAMPVAFASCASSETPSTVNSGANRSNVYPDITAIVRAETQQMSDEEAASFSARLTALSSRRRSGAISEAEYRRQLAELQALRDGHGQTTLSQIQGTN
jgi:hypothetical protein